METTRHFHNPAATIEPPRIARIVLCAALAVCSNAWADDVPLRAEILEVQLNNSLGLEAINGEFQVEIELTNESDQPVALPTTVEEGWQIQCADKPFKSQLVVRWKEKNRTVYEVKPQQAVTGQLKIRVQHDAEEEPTLKLEFGIGEQEFQWNLNEEIRRQTNLRTVRMGPDNCLAAVRMAVPLNHLSVWELSEHLVKLKKAGVTRLVLEIEQKTTVQPDYRSRVAVNYWLSLLGQTIAPRPTTGSVVKPPVQFERVLSLIHI